MLCAQELTEAGLTRVCSSCWASLSPWFGPACARCGLPIAAENSALAPLLCGQCRSDEFAFDFARSYGLYSGNLRTAILLAKFYHRQRVAQRLGVLLESLWPAVQELVQTEELILAPVPLYPSRRRERGFNQAEVITQGLRHAIARQPGRQVPHLDAECLRRTRATAPQAGLSLRGRVENVRGVFEVTSAERLRGRAVVLLDDVMTTGATLTACAAALKQAGARQVLALTLARATPRFPDDTSADIGLPVDEFRSEQT